MFIKGACLWSNLEIRQFHERVQVLLCTLKHAEQLAQRQKTHDLIDFSCDQMWLQTMVPVTILGILPTIFWLFTFWGNTIFPVTGPFIGRCLLYQDTQLMNYGQILIQSATHSLCKVTHSFLLVHHVHDCG